MGTKYYLGENQGLLWSLLQKKKNSYNASDSLEISDEMNELKWREKKICIAQMKAKASEK